MMTSAAAIAAATGLVMYASHQVMDHWGQTSHQAAHKGRPGRIGRWNCAKHVAAYSAVCLVATLGAAAALGYLTQLNPASLVIATVINAGTHYWADRRTTLAGLATRLGLAGFYGVGTPRPGYDDNPSLGTGAYALDQSWHVAWLAVASIVTAIGSA